MVALGSSRVLDFAGEGCLDAAPKAGKQASRERAFVA
jgi:hypothetical protein